VRARPPDEPPVLTGAWALWAGRWVSLEALDAIREATGAAPRDTLPSMTSGRLLALLGVLGSAVAALGFAVNAQGFMLNLERTERRWGGWVRAVERDGAPDDIAWRHATATLRACADVYDHFLT
jgi:hypothetical protein